MSKWKCEICGNNFDNFHAQGFDNKIYCPLCYFKKLCADLQVENETLKKQLEEKDMLIKQCDLSVANAMDCYCERTDCSSRIKDSKKYDSLVQKIENQQQEFINYLEDFISKTDYEVNIMGNYLYLAWSNAYKKVLQKYKEIIGVEDEKES